jgi:predicted amino acid racemase
MNAVTEKIQQVQQMKSIDAAAVVTGFAVWAEYIPTAVGVFTVLWLGMQIVINLPKMCESVKEMYRWVKSKL